MKTVLATLLAVVVLALPRLARATDVLCCNDSSSTCSWENPTTGCTGGGLILAFSGTPDVGGASVSIDSSFTNGICLNPNTGFGASPFCMVVSAFGGFSPESGSIIARSPDSCYYATYQLCSNGNCTSPQALGLPNDRCNNGGDTVEALNATGIAQMGLPACFPNPQCGASCNVNVPDGCGLSYACSCSGGQVCASNNTCCTRTSCTSFCGSIADGCGGTENCGSCAFGSCVNNHCQCTPKTCASLGASCGSYSDGCGGLLQCGGCPSGQECQVNTHVCCTPQRSCASVGATCGQINDGCGFFLNCGTCSDPETTCANLSHTCVHIAPALPGGATGDLGLGSIMAMCGLAFARSRAKRAGM
jgi:hypothetical protein